MQPKVAKSESDGGVSVNGAFAVLLTSDDYFLGLKVLHWSLQSAKSVYPLVVLYTSNVSPVHVQGLVAAGCIVKETTHLRIDDRNNNNYAQPYYGDMWTKLKMFNLTEYSRVVVLDADMLLRQNVDELMGLDIPEGWIAASSGCLCNPMKVPSYPASWCPENCPYTPGTGKPKEELSYFNSGLLVIHPSNTEFERLKTALDRIENLAKYVFADQDFLNQVYAGRWVCLPYTYNALRPLITAHPNMWRDEDVRIVHYIFKKPWLDLDWMARSEEENRKQEFYTVNSWWFQAYEKANLN